MPSSELPLRDIHLPAEIGLWPPAIGWWLLAFIVPLSLFLMFKSYRFITRKTALKSAKKQFKQLQRNAALSEHAQLNQLAILMRRTVISLYPREQVASLTGEAWLNFLDKDLPKAQFNTALGQQLTHSLYQAKPQAYQITPLLNLCEQWLKRQKEPKK